MRPPACIALPGHVKCKSMYMNKRSWNPVRSERPPCRIRTSAVPENPAPPVPMCRRIPGDFRIHGITCSLLLRTTVRRFSKYLPWTGTASSTAVHPGSQYAPCMGAPQNIDPETGGRIWLTWRSKTTFWEATTFVGCVELRSRPASAPTFSSKARCSLSAEAAAGNMRRTSLNS